MLQRRLLILALGSLAFLTQIARTAENSTRGPLFWRATRGKGRVFLLGFGDARDRSWFTPTIERAFLESSELWLETAPATGSNQDDERSRQTAAELEKLAYEAGRTFFDVLDPDVRQRTLAYIAEAGIQKESIEKFRPWRAYYTLVAAFWSKKTLPYEPVYVDAVLRELAAAAGKDIGYEMPRERFVRFMAAMNDKAQSQYIEWLLDYIDDDKNGLHRDDNTFGWVAGEPGASALRSLDRMRKMPYLYQVMQLERNEWWARKIDALLANGGTSFVAVGQLHVLGPDGIPQQLRRLGIVADRDLREISSSEA